MTDTVLPLVRSRMMAAVRGRDTRPEKVVRRALHANGLRFRLHVRSLPGCPDIVLRRWRVAIFVNGCFWHAHGCKDAKLPTTRQDFWREKLQGNALRDKKNINALRSEGWRVLVVWECQLDAAKRANNGRFFTALASSIRRPRNSSAIGATYSL
jgi:DNA mismatch endonuclease (patch repair protein)